MSSQNPVEANARAAEAFITRTNNPAPWAVAACVAAVFVVLWVLHEAMEARAFAGRWVSRGSGAVLAIATGVMGRSVAIARDGAAGTRFLRSGRVLRSAANSSQYAALVSPSTLVVVDGSGSELFAREA